jgi:hypothetical protein
MILDTKGHIFGGFTPVGWESRVSNGKKGIEDNTWKCDESGQSFLFTFRNPHNIRARIFRLKADKKQFAMRCLASSGPGFGDGFYTSNQCNVTQSGTFDFGLTHTNDTGIDGKTFFTGADKFIVKEIEVFEMTDQRFGGAGPQSRRS